MPTGTDLGWLAAMAAIIVLAVVFAVRRTQLIRDGRADPVNAPDWTSLERKAPPPSAIRWGFDDRPEVEDEHVGRPFPSTAGPRSLGDLSRDRRKSP